MDSGHKVKIWYKSGAFEQVSNLPEEAASRIFWEVSKSARVDCAEIHAPNGSMVQHVWTDQRD